MIENMPDRGQPKALRQLSARQAADRQTRLVEVALRRYVGAALIGLPGAGDAGERGPAGCGSGPTERPR